MIKRLRVHIPDLSDPKNRGDEYVLLADGENLMEKGIVRFSLEYDVRKGLGTVGELTVVYLVKDAKIAGEVEVQEMDEGPGTPEHVATGEQAM